MLRVFGEHVHLVRVRYVHLTLTLTRTRTLALTLALTWYAVAAAPVEPPVAEPTPTMRRAGTSWVIVLAAAVMI